MSTLFGNLHRTVRTGMLIGVLATACLATDGPIPDPQPKGSSGQASTNSTVNPDPTTDLTNPLTSILTLLGVIFGH